MTAFFSFWTQTGFSPSKLARLSGRVPLSFIVLPMFLKRAGKFRAPTFTQKSLVSTAKVSPISVPTRLREEGCRGELRCAAVSSGDALLSQTL